MSVAFSSARPRSKGEVTQQTIQKMLDENHHLIQCIMDYQSKGKTAECTQYQQVLHGNLVFLAMMADSTQNMQSLLPAPPTSSMGPGGMSQSGGHAPNHLSDNVTPGLPPTSMMQSHMSNGPSHGPIQSGHHQPPSGSYGGSGSGYSHVAPSSQGSMIQSSGPYGSSSSSSMSSSFPPSSRSNLNMQSSQGEPVSVMHQQSAPPHYSSAQSGGQHYQGPMGMMGQGSQGINIMSQRPMGSYRSYQQGSAQHYMGQEEFYGEQHGHTQSSSEPINQQYYADGHGEYSYQQSSYGEQGYDGSFESSQHYYEGGNSRYSQQQYSSQQGYSGQPQGYGPGQGGSSQFLQYQQNQQYGSYRSSQGGVQTQRPYAYEQGQYGNYPQ